MDGLWSERLLESLENRFAHRFVIGIDLNGCILVCGFDGELLQLIFVILHFKFGKLQTVRCRDYDHPTFAIYLPAATILANAARATPV